LLYISLIKIYKPYAKPPTGFSTTVGVLHNPDGGLTPRQRLKRNITQSPNLPFLPKVDLLHETQ
jgi:hypothetical protein